MAGVSSQEPLLEVNAVDMFRSQKEKNILSLSGKQCVTDSEKDRLKNESSDKDSVECFSMLTQVLAAVTISLGSMITGFSAGYSSPALVSMSEDSNISSDVTLQVSSWIGGVMPLAALLGGIAGGPMIERLGRKKTLFSTAAPFILSWVIIASSGTVYWVLVGRAISGFCVGLASLTFPVYLSETIHPRIRGTLGLLPTGLGNIGILLAFVGGYFLNWWQLAVLGAFLSLPFLLLMYFIPETPRWFVSKGKREDALRSLLWLRGGRTQVEKELAEIEMIHEASKNSSLWKSLFTYPTVLPFGICLGLMFFQQFSGINVVIFYTVTIFKETGWTLDDNLSTIIVGLVNFISTFIATVLIDRVGRKTLLYVSSVSMIVSLTVLGVFFNGTISEYKWVPLASLMIFVLGFSLGFGPIPWLMMGEILPGNIRGTAASLTTAFNWTCTFIVTKTFADLTGSIGIDGTFYLFASFTIVGLVFIASCVPETKGKSLERIEKEVEELCLLVRCCRVPKSSSIQEEV